MIMKKNANKEIEPSEEVELLKAIEEGDLDDFYGLNQLKV